MATLDPGRQALDRSFLTTARGRIVIEAGGNTATVDLDGDTAAGPSEDNFGMTRQATDVPRR